MDLKEALLESWDRQCEIVNNVAGLVTEETRHFKPSEDGWPLYHQLAHMHLVRKGWLNLLSQDRASALPKTFTDGWTTPIEDLEEIKRALKESEIAIREVMRDHLEKGTQRVEGSGGHYDHPVFFLQHMIWHEGWHVGLIFLAFRMNGQELQEEWEEPNVWSKWRTETW